tara:strand:- start:766 stop:972 length:207 start_codon:yes stop_codon:yes gene_type:complete
MMAFRFIINCLVFYIFFSIIFSLMGCSTTEDVGCVPIHIGTAIDEEGNMHSIQVEEHGCPPLDTWREK